MMIVDNKYNLKDYVYLTTDREQSKRVVTGIFIRISSIMYELTLGSTCSCHYEFEISEQEDTLIRTDN